MEEDKPDWSQASYQAWILQTTQKVIDGEQFASVLVSDLHKSNEETLRLRARIAELEALLEKGKE